MALQVRGERVHMLLSLVAHAGGYRMMVGAYNTVECQMHVGGLCCLLRVWQTSAPATLLVPRGMLGVLPCLPGMVNAGAHNTVDASEARGGSLTVFVWYGSCLRPQHCRENVGAYNNAWVLSCQEGRRVLSCRCIGYVPRYCG